MGAYLNLSIAGGELRLELVSHGLDGLFHVVDVPLGFGLSIEEKSRRYGFTKPVVQGGSVVDERLSCMLAPRNPSGFIIDIPQRCEVRKP